MTQTTIKTTVEELKKLIDIDNCMGEPIETDDKILIPVSKVGFAFGAGSKKSNDESDVGAGAAGIEPISMIVITKGVKGIEGIRVLSLSKASELNKTINDIGLIVGDVIKERFPINNEDKTLPKEDNEKIKEPATIIDIE